MKKKIVSILTWLDNNHFDTSAELKESIDWLRVLPFILIHLGCVAVLWVGFSATALITCAIFYALRIFAIGGFYHRYFSHKSFKTSRVAQFIFAVLGASATQRGPLWWASHHRYHHTVSDQEQDVHSPVQHGFFRSHMGWFLIQKNFYPKTDLIKDFAKYPELVFIDRFDFLVPLVLGLVLFITGSLLNLFLPALHTTGWQLVVWGFCISTVLVFHATFIVNSLGHKFGSQPFKTKDHSRNNWIIATLTFGEGWHNNHHRFACASRQGFYWWQLDITYYLLRLLGMFGIIWDLREVPAHVLEEGRKQTEQAKET